MFVAINTIQCLPDYTERFESLFQSRAGAIDHMPGFQRMYVLKPAEEGEGYLIVSHWDSEADFQAWTRSDAFREGHRRGFADLEEARNSGRPLPMQSRFRTYSVLSE